MNKIHSAYRLVARPSPEVEVMSLDAAKLHLRVDHDSEDDLIAALVTTAAEYIENKGRCLLTQTWDLVMDNFPDYRDDKILIYKNPVQSVEFIQYIDTGGVTQTWPIDEYRVSLTSEPARIEPAYGFPWPFNRDVMDSVIIRFIAGYGNEPGLIPERAYQAIKLLIGHLYINREAVTVIQGIVSLNLPLGFQAMLDSFIVKGFY